MSLDYNEIRNAIKVFDGNPSSEDANKAQQLLVEAESLAREHPCVTAMDAAFNLLSIFEVVNHLDDDVEAHLNKVIRYLSNEAGIDIMEFGRPYYVS